MTVHRRDGGGTPFGDWLRQNPRLDSVQHLIAATDVDFLIHKYTPRQERREVDKSYLDLLMLVEVKTFFAEPSYSQRDTLSVIEQLLRLATVKGNRRRTIKINETRIEHLSKSKIRSIRWYGVHLLQLSGDSPANSATILWDKKKISEHHLTSILCLDFDPDYPTRRIDTRRHHRRPAVTLPLFEAAS